MENQTPEKIKILSKLDTGGTGKLFNPLEYDYLLVTDGSSFYLDGFGGWSAIITDVETLEYQVFYGCGSETSVYYQEFFGLVEGLHRLTNAEVFPTNFFEGATVLWLCDCQSLVTAVESVLQNGEYPKTNRDMWARFEYLNSKLQLQPVHTPRDDGGPLHEIVDYHASTMREILKNYSEQ